MQEVGCGAESPGGKCIINIEMSQNTSYFAQFIEEVEEKVDLAEALKAFSDDYVLSGYKIDDIKPANAVELHKSIQDKFYKKEHEGLSSNWYENELRIFVWSLVCYAHLKNSRIENFNHQDWDFFCRLFRFKDPRLFEYQARALAKEPVKGKHWEKYEEDLLKDIMRSNADKIKWNQVSKQLFHLSNKKYFRTAKQCREHWNNHLDPKKIKGNWKMHECLIMFQFVRKEGKKWANLVKRLGNSRNEHSIKNKFNSLVKKQKKLNRNLQDEEIYDVIISRIEKAMNKEHGKSTEMSFEEDCNSSNMPLKQEIVESSMKEELPKTSSYTEKFRRKLQNFNIASEKGATVSQMLTEPNLKLRNSAQEHKKEQRRFQKLHDSCSISEKRESFGEESEGQSSEEFLDLEPLNPGIMQDQLSPEEEERRLKESNVLQ